MPAAFTDDKVLEWLELHTVPQQLPTALKAKLFILWPCFSLLCFVYEEYFPKEVFLSKLNKAI